MVEAVLGCFSPQRFVRIRKFILIVYIIYRWETATQNLHDGCATTKLVQLGHQRKVSAQVHAKLSNVGSLPCLHLPYYNPIFRFLFLCN